MINKEASIRAMRPKVLFGMSLSRSRLLGPLTIDSKLRISRNLVKVGNLTSYRHLAQKRNLLPKLFVYNAVLQDQFLAAFLALKLEHQYFFRERSSHAL